MAILAPVKWFKQFESSHRPSITSQLTFEQRLAKRRESEAIQQAEENGVFTSISREFVIANFVRTTLSPSDDNYHALLWPILSYSEFMLSLGQNSGICVTDLVAYSVLTQTFPKAMDGAISLLRVIVLSGMRVRQVDYLGCCTGLQLIDLSSNFVSRIDVLISCCNLIRLDVHSNQIETLPGPEFWSRLTKLQILYLHDNPIANLRSVFSLSICPSLAVLTLFATPLCLRSNYRHQIVNTIDSLKALDRFVVSDQEIIEGADFDARFAAFGPQFAIQPTQPVKAGDELLGARRLLRQINRILAHHSPVVMMQRCIRGHLTRRRLGCVEDNQLWAAVLIQRAYKDWKNRRTGEQVGTYGPPPPSPCERPPTDVTLAESVGLDYDTYLDNCRHGSIAADVLSTGGRPGRTASTTKHPVSGPPRDGRPVRVHVDLERLQQTVLRNCSEVPHDQLALYIGPPENRNDRQPKLEVDEEEKENIDRVPFRLRVCGVRAPTVPRRVSADTLRAERKRDADVVRRMTQSLHADAAKTSLVVARRRSDGDVSTASKQRRRRPRGSAAPWLACLESVADDYRRIEAEEKAAALRAEVRRRREARDGARAAVAMELDRKRSWTGLVEATDRRALASALTQRDAAQQLDVETRTDARRHAADVTSSRRQSDEFADRVARRMGACSRAHVRFVQLERQDSRCRQAASMIQHQRDERRERNSEVERIIEARRLAVAKRTELDKYDNDVTRLRQLVSKQVEAHERVKAAQEAAAEASLPGARRSRLVLPIVSNPQ